MTQYQKRTANIEDSLPSKHSSLGQTLPTTSTTAPAGNNNNKTGSINSNNQPALPSLSLPKGGGAIRGLGEKYSVNPATGTGTLSIPIYASPGRSGFGPQLSLNYDS